MSDWPRFAILQLDRSMVPALTVHGDDRLTNLAYLPPPLSDERQAERWRIVFNDPSKIPAASKRNACSLSVLVQNRRKDGVPVLVLGGRAQVVTTPGALGDVLRGRVADDNMIIYSRGG